jgi:hypothetical protein
VPAGGLAFDQTHWIPCRHAHFFLPVKVLASKFRGQFLALLRRAFRRGQLRLLSPLASRQERKAFDRFTWALKRKEWVVYAKKPFSGPQHVVRYLAHYTHRVAISNGRLLRFENGQVTFRWRDSAHGNRQKAMTLTALEFMRRFLLHVLPRGFVKIRHFGYLANREKKARSPLVLDPASAIGFCCRQPTGSAPGASSGQREMSLPPTRQTGFARALECRATPGSKAPARPRYVMTRYPACIPGTCHGRLVAVALDVCLDSIPPVIPLTAALLPAACEVRAESVKRLFS